MDDEEAIVDRHEVSDQEIDQLLRELVTAQDLLTLSRWPFETARWYELVGAVLRVVGEVEPVEPVLETLTRLGLVDIDELVSMPEDGEPDTAAEAARGLTEAVLVRSGVAAGAARRVVAVVVELATVVREKHGGRVQVLLRRQGELVLDNLVHELSLASVDERAARALLTAWLQRTLDLPLPMADGGTDVGGARVEMGRLVDAADRLDLNVAILDELLTRHDALRAERPATASSE